MWSRVAGLCAAASPSFTKFRTLLFVLYLRNAPRVNRDAGDTLDTQPIRVRLRQLRLNVCIARREDGGNCRGELLGAEWFGDQLSFSKRRCLGKGQRRERCVDYMGRKQIVKRV